MKHGVRIVLFCLLLSVAIPMAAAQFTLQDDGKALTILDGGKSVLSYNYVMVRPPGGEAQGRYARSCYIQPLYGVDGDVLTEDFPADHYHHRGVFWAWPKCEVDGKALDVWLSAAAKQVFERWLRKDVGADRAVVSLNNVWKLTGDPEPKLRETITFTVYPVEGDGRAIDFSLSFANLCPKPINFLGAAGKGYGGFCVRMDAQRKDPVITIAQGPLKEDALRAETPWADFSSRATPGGGYSGIAIFQHPKNPGYPHSGWILRYYGLFGAAWPHLETFALQPGQSLDLRYRLYLHRGGASEARVAEQFAHFVDSAKK